MAAGMAAGLLSGLWVVNLRIGLPVAAAVFGAPMLVGLAGWHWAPAGAAVVAAGAGLYFLHRGFGLARTMQPFAATLAMMVIARGAAKWFSGGAKVQSADVPRFYGWLTTGRFPPLIIVFLAVVALAWVMLRWTRTGRHLYAVGGNAEAARLSGVRVRTVSTLTYVLCGLTASLAGIGQVARTTLGDPEAGAGYELDAIAAVVIGGTNLMGGRGGVLLTLLGVLMIGVLEKYLSLHGWETWARLMAKGAIVVLAVAMQRQRR
jgi:ribose/xylose/arabinose/galactoside ABC-type transport system permease subunit